MRTEQLWERLAAICVHAALTKYRWYVFTRQVASGKGGKTVRVTVLVILTRFTSILTGDCLSYNDNC